MGNPYDSISSIMESSGNGYHSNLFRLLPLCFLIIVIFRKLRGCKLVGAWVRCPLCLQGFDHGDASWSPRNCRHHVFHPTCLRRWLYNDPLGITCPACSPQTASEYSAVKRGEEEGSAESGGECPICLEEFRNGKVYGSLPNCGHRFHEACVASWFRQQVTGDDAPTASVPSCPVCRQEADTPAACAEFSLSVLVV